MRSSVELRERVESIGISSLWVRRLTAGDVCNARRGTPRGCPREKQPAYQARRSKWHATREVGVPRRQGGLPELTKGRWSTHHVASGSGPIFRSPLFSG